MVDCAKHGYFKWELTTQDGIIFSDESICPICWAETNDYVVLEEVQW